jgi:hypothetical protein
MDQATVLIDQDIAVMSVFNLQNKRDNCVCSKGPDEVIPRKFELRGRFSSVPLQEVLMKVDLKCFAELVSRVRILYNFDDATEDVVLTCSVRDASIGCNVKIKVILLENLLEMFDKL